MDEKINAYLESLVTEALNSPMFSSLAEDQKASLAGKIRTRLNGVIIDMVVDNLTDEQFNAIKDFPPDSVEMEDKIEEYASGMPDLAQNLEEKLNQEISEIKQNPQLISQNA